jgi:hypothetical protein
MEPAIRLFLSVLLASAVGSCGGEQGTTTPTSPTATNGVYLVQIQSLNISGLPPCNSKTGGETAMITSTLTLVSCMGGVWVPIPCTALIGGSVAYNSTTKTLWTCTQNPNGGAPQWMLIPLPQGPAGQQGPQGAAGATSLVVQTPESSGTNCPNGGTKVESGVDTDGNGSLEGTEITSTSYVCKGDQGETGATGPVGPTGQTGQQGDAGAPGTAGATSLVALTPFTGASGPCTDGGTKIESGIDSNGDGQLAAGEVTSTSFICSGANGAAALLSSIVEPPGLNCSAGGWRIQGGSDTNQNDILDPAEVTQTFYLCHGSGTGLPVTRFDDAVCDPQVGPDIDHGVFVDATAGDDTLGSGTPDAPLKSLAVAVPLAVALERTSLYLAEGTYESSLNLPSGCVLFVEGSWQRSAGGWHRRCDAGAHASTIISKGVVASGVDGGLRSLTVLANGDFSNIAARVAAGKLVIRDTVLQAGAGVNSTAPGQDGSSYAGNPNSHSYCESGANGAAGINGSHGSGEFTSQATYSPGDGAAGQAGQSGSNGTPGQKKWCNTSPCGSSSYDCNFHDCNPHDCNPYECNCLPLGGCGTCYETCWDLCWDTCYSNCVLVYSNQGYYLIADCGKGGKGGAAATGGKGGGASAALVVASGATVNVIGSTLSAGNGGNGTGGGIGAAGSAGTEGYAQSSSDCTQGCEGTGPNCPVLTGTVSAVMGGKGGNGGKGGDGGGGAGGPSAAVVKVGTAVVVIDSQTTLTYGSGGLGGSGAPDGNSGTELSQP